MRKLATALMLILLIFFLALVLADAGDIDMRMRLQPPSSSHLMGTDSFGRDLLERLAAGLMVSIMIALAATALSLGLGLCLSYAFFIRPFSSPLFTTLLLSLKAIPTILLALFLNSLTGPGVMKLVLVLAIGHAADVAQTAYSRIIVLRSEDYVVAAIGVGESRSLVFLRHVLPEVFRTLIFQAISVFSSSILTEASLSFLGCGIPVTIPSVGGILAEARTVMSSAPWMVAFPALALLVIGVLLELAAVGLSESDPASERAG